VLEDRFEHPASLLVAEHPLRLRVGELALANELSGLEDDDVLVLEKFVADEGELRPAARARRIDRIVGQVRLELEVVAEQRDGLGEAPLAIATIECQQCCGVH
jgi:hypothetical protein